MWHYLFFFMYLAKKCGWWTVKGCVVNCDRALQEQVLPLHVDSTRCDAAAGWLFRRMGIPRSKSWEIECAPLSFDSYR